MTRTERATHPRALNKDRSESRTGLDPNLRKGGAGGHNWGSLADESYFEASAIDDEDMDIAADNMEGRKAGSEAIDISPKPPMERASSGSSVNSSPPTEEERERARKARKNAFKKGDQIDLATIARTSAAVTNSPPKTDGIIPRSGSDNNP